MTESPTAIMAEFDRLWAIGKKTIPGPDTDRIIKAVADQFEVSQAHVRRIVEHNAGGLWG